MPRALTGKQDGAQVRVKLVSPDCGQDAGSGTRRVSGHTSPVSGTGWGTGGRRAASVLGPGQGTLTGPGNNAHRGWRLRGRPLSGRVRGATVPTCSLPHHSPHSPLGRLCASPGPFPPHRRALESRPRRRPEDTCEGRCPRSLLYSHRNFTLRASCLCPWLSGRKGALH